MKVTFYGAARTTTGSQYLIEVNEHRILMECGLFQGRREESLERNRTFAFDPKTIDVSVVSHAHIDHVGNFPNLYRKGFQSNIFCTFATRDLAALMLADSAEIQRADCEYISKQRAKKGLPPVEPLYDAHDAHKVSELFVTISYNRPMQIAPGVKVTFVDAGHILGAAQVILDVEERGRKFRYLFSGDIGRPNQDILRDPVAVENVDFLQIESTYGDREHHDPVDARGDLCRLVSEALTRGGKVIIPAFAVGRTQQLVYELHRLTDEGKLDRVPIFVDSPLAVNATEIFRLHPECFDEETYEYLHNKGNPFGMENLTYIRDVSYSKKLNELKDPCIIISASGMAEAGRIRHHLINHGKSPKNLILFVGFCAEHTLGAHILSGAKVVNIFGEPHEIKAEVARIDAFSGHAGKSELIQYVNAITGNIRKIVAVHGEETSALAWGDTLRKLKPKAEVLVPFRGQSIEF